jgi:two-component system, OmpR family, alkaline phosphatase synthesis response regulator PhoP
MATKADILLVDDDRDIRDSMKIVLEKNGYSVRTAVNGKDALTELKKNLPDIMLLDIMMSHDTEGFDLAFELRQIPHFENLPIIIMSSFLDKVRAEGPDQYQHILGESWPAKWMFEKPVDPKKLIQKIEEVLKKG